MDIKPRNVALKCLFCDEVLQGPVDAEYDSGNLIECLSCGESNDVDSVIEIAKQEGVEDVKGEIREALTKEFGKLLR